MGQFFDFAGAKIIEKNGKTKFFPKKMRLNAVFSYTILSIRINFVSLRLIKESLMLVIQCRKADRVRLKTGRGVSFSRCPATVKSESGPLSADDVPEETKPGDLLYDACR